ARSFARAPSIVFINLTPVCRREGKRAPRPRVCGLCGVKAHMSFNAGNRAMYVRVSVSALFRFLRNIAEADLNVLLGPAPKQGKLNEHSIRSAPIGLAVLPLASPVKAGLIVRHWSRLRAELEIRGELHLWEIGEEAGLLQFARRRHAPAVH